MSEADEKKGRGRKKGRPGKLFWVFIGLLFLTGLAYLAASNVGAARLASPDFVWPRIIKPILRTLIFISFGLLAGQLIESLGWTARLGRLAWPLINWARLPGAAGAAFTSAFVSGVLANTMLFVSRQEGKLDKKGLVLSNMLNSSLPAYVLHMPTTMFIVISLTGRAGAYYVFLTFLAALLRLVGVAAVGRAIMPECPSCAYEDPGKKKTWSQAWTDTWPKFKTRISRMILIVVPVYLGVVFVAESGFFEWLRDQMTALFVAGFVPVESMGLVVFAVVAEFTSGFAAAGALLQAGTLSIKEVVAALLIGNILATPVRALRHQLPHYMGIYTPKLGGLLIVLGQSVRATSVLIVLILFLVCY